MNKDVRVIVGGERDQGIKEKLVYPCTPPSSWGTPLSATFTAYDITSGADTDVTGTILSGSGSVDGSQISTPLVQNLTLHHRYEVHCTFTTATNTLDFVIPIKAVR